MGILENTRYRVGSGRLYYEPFVAVEVSKYMGVSYIDFVCPSNGPDGVRYGLRCILDGDKFKILTVFEQTDSKVPVRDDFESRYSWSDPVLEPLKAFISPTVILEVVERSLENMRPGIDGKLSSSPDALMAVLLALDVHGEEEEIKMHLLRGVLEWREWMNSSVWSYGLFRRCRRRQAYGEGGSLEFSNSLRCPGGVNSFLYYRRFSENVQDIQSSVRKLLASLQSTCHCLDTIGSLDLSGTDGEHFVTLFASFLKNQRKVPVELTDFLYESGSFSRVEQGIVDTYVQVLLANMRIDVELSEGRAPRLTDVLNRDLFTQRLLRYYISSRSRQYKFTKQVFDQIIEIGKRSWKMYGCASKSQ